MRRPVLLLLLILSGLVGLVSVNAESSDPPNREHIAINPQPADSDLMVRGLWHSVEAEVVQIDNPRSTRAANDSCLSIDNLTFTQNETQLTWLASDATLVNSFGVDSSDPSIASCSDGNLSSAQGYRTAWYRFEAPATGRATIEVLPNFGNASNYDAVLLFMAGNDCAALTQLVCNDDSNGLLPAVTNWVTEGQTYMIEVADRNLSVNGQSRLDIQVLIETSDLWSTKAEWNTEDVILSRHVAEVIGDEIYVFGGQTIVDETVPTRSGRNFKFNPATNSFTTLASMPPECATEGYSNNQAAYLAYSDTNLNRDVRYVYFPTGYVGDNTTYSGQHCVYDVDADAWLLTLSDGNAPADATFTNGATIFNQVSEFRDIGYFVVGGLSGTFLTNGTNITSAQAQFFFADGNSWQNYPDLPGGRYSHTGVMLDDRFLCSMGGIRADATQLLLLTDGVCLDVNNTSNGWQSIAGTNIPRFNATSIVGPDGRWYVFGGVSADTSGSLFAVPEVEVYDAATNTWRKLDSRHNLDTPARALAAGGAIGQTVYMIGGEGSIASTGVGGFVAGIVESFNMDFAHPWPDRAFLPMMPHLFGQASLDTQAYRFDVNGYGVGEFPEGKDVFFVHRVEVPTVGSYQVNLINIPRGDNYDVYVYDNNKLLRGSGTNVGNLDEDFTLTLNAGTHYFIVVAELNDVESGGVYRLWVRSQ